jgi:hypothetical protein
VQLPHQEPFKTSTKNSVKVQTTEGLDPTSIEKHALHVKQLEKKDGPQDVKQETSLENADLSLLVNLGHNQVACNPHDNTFLHLPSRSISTAGSTDKRKAPTEKVPAR